MAKPEEDILKNLKDFYVEIADICGYTSGTYAGLDYVWNKKATWPSYLLGHPQLEQALHISEEISRHGLPPFWIMDDKNDSDLIKLLDNMGIRAIRRWRGMLLNPDAYISHQKPNVLRIGMNRKEDIPDWLRLVNEELMSGNKLGTELSVAFQNSEHFRWINAYIDDTHVASGLLYSFEGVAGIYMVVTKSEFRGKGFGTCMTSFLIDYSLQQGVDRIVLHATPMGEGLYRRLGFESVNDISIFWKLGY